MNKNQLDYLSCRREFKLQYVHDFSTGIPYWGPSYVLVNSIYLGNWRTDRLPTDIHFQLNRSIPIVLPGSPWKLDKALIKGGWKLRS